MDGVTTIVTGDCGHSASDLAAWFRGLAAGGIGPNIASLDGHGSIRRAIIGPLIGAAAKPRDHLRHAERPPAFLRAEGGDRVGHLHGNGRGNNTTEAIATATQAPRGGVRILCDFLVISGFLAKDGNEYWLTIDSALQE